ncbi:ATP-binding protein [Desulfospira joergensenii]|uniref:ATP-binding protein n=1 Tax=Desulfospira joergensenii TaxID=53329 RepID=UPI0003B50CFE|nr:ATP-binding protein [Desulfospira joergensenii]
MLKDYPLQLQVKQIAASLETNIRRFHAALYELRRLSQVLFLETRATESDIDAWFKQEGFGIDEDGFWLSLPNLKAFRENRAPGNILSHSWHPDLVRNRDACFRMYALRNLGPFLEEIRSGLSDAAWIYYQDITNTSIQFPYIDQITAITPDFDWSSYHTYQSVAPENNPEGKIQWTPPSIDYAGEGLILSVSIPVDLKGNFIGLWSIDLPMKSLYPEFVFDTLLKGQVNFIADQMGLLVAHPSIETRIDREKGSIFQHHFHELGPGFNTLKPEKLLDRKSGQFALSPPDGEEVVGYFEVIPGIQWIFFSAFPRQSMEDVVNQRIRNALDRVGSGDFSYRLETVSGIEQARLIAEGFNKMASALENQENLRKKNQEEKEKLEERLRHYQKMEAIGTLAGGIAHDFNNILFPIIGYAELLTEDLPRGSPHHDMVREIYQAASRARDLTRQILTFSRQSELKNQAVSFQSIIKEALKLLRSSIPSDIEILQNIQPDCSPVFADPTKLHQIIMNLCTNAFHAVQEKSGRFEVCLEEIKIDSEYQTGTERLVPGTYARLTVADTGCGMDKQTLMQIFDPYFTTKKKGKGTGLGLSVCYGIVKKLNGDIKVYSEPGQGTSFHIYLPAADSSAEEDQVPEARIPGGTEKILLVDDEQSIAEMCRNILQKYGYRVSAFVDSSLALEAFEKSPADFDLVITDMTMPGMTGDVLAGRIKKIRKEIPVILCTGFSEKISRKDYQGKAIDEFLMKPITVHKFAGAVRNLLENRKKEAG